MIKRFILRKLTLIGLKTYPPICKNSDGVFARFRRETSAVLIYIVVGGNKEEYENFLKQEIAYIKDNL